MPHNYTADHADIAACRALLRHGSRSFHAASLLLPARIRNPATALYAFCREADDAIDLGGDATKALAALKLRLARACAGVPEPSPVDRAFAAVLAEFDIPHALPAALLEGLSWDAQARRYPTLESLLDYAARVAGAVGVMMALLMGVRDPASLARAADLGVAMQLTNIARDVGEDAAAGRLFLPLSWLAQEGIDPERFLAAPEMTPSLGRIVRRLLEEADTLYIGANAGIARLPPDCRAGIAIARRLYAAIGQKVAAAGYDSINRRARVRGYHKLILALGALPGLLAGALAPRRADRPALPANLFLIDAVGPGPAPEPATGRAVKLLILFERLERIQREAAGRMA